MSWFTMRLFFVIVVLYVSVFFCGVDAFCVSGLRCPGSGSKFVRLASSPPGKGFSSPNYRTTKDTPYPKKTWSSLSAPMKLPIGLQPKPQLTENERKDRIDSEQRWKRIEQGDRDASTSKAGGVFTTPRRRVRSDPWWMQESELKNPRALPEYKPWWLLSNPLVDMDWKVVDLRKEASRRGLKSSGMLKKDLVEQINALHHKFSLADDNFSTATILPTPPNIHKCYPENYEKDMNLSSAK